MRLTSNSVTYPDREAWLAARFESIGGSDAAAVLGKSKWESPYSLWSKKYFRIDSDEDGLWLELGHMLEQPAALLYERFTQREVHDLGAFTVQIHPVFPYLTCTLDRLASDVEKGLICVNLKAVGAAKAGDWETRVPTEYWIQVQHEMAVTGLSWASLGVIIGNYDFRWCDVARDSEFIEQTLLPAHHEFWGRVLSGRAPGVDGEDATGRMLHFLYDRADAGTITLDGGFVDIDAELCDVLRQLGELESRKKMLQNRIKAAMGFNERALVPGCAEYSWSVTGGRNGYQRRFTRRALT